MKGKHSTTLTDLQNLAGFLDLLIQIDLSLPKKTVQVKAKSLK